MVDTSTIDLRRSTHRSSVFEGQHIHLRRSTHRSSKVDTSISKGRHLVTSIFEGRHIDLRKSTHRSSKVDASIFEDRRRKHHTHNSSSNIVHYCAPNTVFTLGTVAVRYPGYGASTVINGDRTRLHSIAPVYTADLFVRARARAISKF